MYNSNIRSYNCLNSCYKVLQWRELLIDDYSQYNTDKMADSIRQYQFHKNFKLQSDSEYVLHEHCEIFILQNLLPLRTTQRLFSLFSFLWYYTHTIQTHLRLIEKQNREESEIESRAENALVVPSSKFECNVKQTECKPIPKTRIKLPGYKRSRTNLRKPLAWYTLN